MNSELFDDKTDVWSELPQPLRGAAQAVHAATPPAVDMGDFLTRLTEQQPAVGAENSTGVVPVETTRVLPTRLPRTYAPHRIWRVGAAPAGLAACAIAVLVLLPPASANALDEIARALRGRICVKMTTTGPDGRTSENWYLTGKNVSAWRSDEWIEYRDHETQITQTFDRVEKKLYRTSESFARRNDFLVDLIESLSSLAESRPVRQIKGMDVLSTKVRTIERDGVEQREVEVKLQPPRKAKPIVAIIILGRQENLPQLVRVSGHHEGEELRLVSRFEYPDAGPADVFDLEVPRDTELIDRIPSTDVKRLVAGVYAGRLRFDDYRAIILRGTDSKAVSDDSQDIMMIARQGTKTAYLRAALPVTGELAAKGREELAKRLLTQHDAIRWYPVAVTHGQTRYWFDTSFHYPANGGQTIEIAAVQTYTETGMAPEDSVLPS